MIDEVTRVRFEIAEGSEGHRTSRGPGEGRPEGLDELLSDPHCRHLVEYLRERGEPVDVERLAAHVAARTRAVPVDSIGTNVRRRVQTWLHHGQLPALAARGVVEYDAESGVVRLVDDGR